MNRARPHPSQAPCAGDPEEFDHAPRPADRHPADVSIRQRLVGFGLLSLAMLLVLGVSASADLSDATDGNSSRLLLIRQHAIDFLITVADHAGRTAHALRARSQ